MPSVNLAFTAAGGNRHPAAADWNDDLLAFGSGKNIAVYSPKNKHSSGIRSLLSGHTGDVNAIRILRLPTSKHRLIISGSADHTIRIWKRIGSSLSSYKEIACLSEHQASVNTIAVLPGCGSFVTGAADATLRVWKFTDSEIATDHAEGFTGQESPVGHAYTLPYQHECHMIITSRLVV